MPTATVVGLTVGVAAPLADAASSIASGSANPVLII
ncbi:hypothetical protein HD841_003575 [Sphingomonas melonis]|uniref:Uncharacterized protein n=1 Tax=Sphingomonas melonis TaxID=152682 RepID=A0A7Y9K492_9SPHN|nr:hypothetical protein [Sphingomonas melonis]